GINHLFYIIKNILGEQVNYAFEDPGYCWGREYFDSNNRSNFSLNIDSEGASIENVINEKNIALLLTPAHQFPLGIIMSKKRKKEILNWLKEDDTRYLIEDDYDGEFNFSNTRFIPLYKNDENIIYIGSFSRSITPALRISYMIIPDGLLKKYDQIFNGFECPCSLFTQKALGVFIEDGYFERHVNRMRNLYTKKKEIIEKKLSNNNHIKIINDINGLVALIDIDLNDKKQFENRLLKEKIKLTSINRFQKRSENSDYYILDYSKIEINRLNDAIDTLIEIVKELE
ncbi:MAG: hypothetical protein Q4B52_07025, partial [Tissierellia bacterium]|nr:hypothetical protein [Tissierellia bacterium]